MELLGRLRKAVRKLTFLINLKNYLSLAQSTLRLAALVRARAPATITGRRWGRRAISFNDRPGLRACMEDGYDPGIGMVVEDNYDDGSSEVGSSSNSNSPCVLRRTSSVPLEDVDRQADMFIENFYKHLIYEKQVSLELRYCRDDNSSFNSSGTSVVSPLSSAGSPLVSPT